jgi:predicted RNA-binding Zn ribbon-like protein
VTHASTQGFQLIAGNLALDFVNTVGHRLGERREYFDSVAAVRRWARLAGLVPKGAPVAIPDGQLDAVRETREALYRLFHGMVRDAAPSPAMLASLNAALAAVLPKRQLQSHASGVHWHWKASSRDPDRVLGPILLSAAELLVSGSHPTIGQCDDETCGWLFLDRSRAGRRRWCSMADCGNRAKVRRHYRQQTRARA